MIAREQIQGRTTENGAATTEPLGKLTSPSLRASLARLVSGSLIAQLVTICTMPVVTRLFSSEQLGALGVFAAFLAVPSAFICMRFDAAIFVARSNSEVRRLCVLCMGVASLTIGVSTLVFVALSSSSRFGLGAIPAWSALFLAAILMATAFGAVFRALLLRSQRYAPLAVAAAVRSFLVSGVRLLGGVLGGGLFALLMAELISAFAVLRIFQPRNFGSRLHWAGRERMKRLAATARRWKAFPIFETPSVLVDQVLAAVPILVIAERAGPSAAGLYAIAYRVVALPSAHIGASISEVFRGRCAAHVRDGHRAQARHLFFRMSGYLVACSLCSYIPLALVAPPYFGTVFGAEWGEAGALVPWLALAAGAALVTSPLSSILQVLRCQHLKWIYDATSIALLGWAVYSTHGNNVIDYIRLLSIAGALSCVAYYCVLCYSLRRI